MILSEFDLNVVHLLPGKIFLLTETELTQYFIKDWGLAYWHGGMRLGKDFVIMC